MRRIFHRSEMWQCVGSGTYALHEAMELSPIAEGVTILTDGQTPEFSLPDSVTNISVDTGKIKELTGEELLSSVVFEDGKALDVSGVFVAIGTAGSSDLARKLGAVTEGTKIAVNGEMATNIPGLYAAGDCTPGMLQVQRPYIKVRKLLLQLSNCAITKQIKSLTA